MTPAVNGSTWAGGRLASSVFGWVTLPHAARKSSETANIHLKNHFAIEANSHTVDPYQRLRRERKFTAFIAITPLPAGNMVVCDAA